MLIYHLASAERWRSWPRGTAYLPAEYEADGFIHCTAGEELMLAVANRFYRGVPEPFVLLTLDAELLSAPLRWEAPDDDLAESFPHIYGAINPVTVIMVRAVERVPHGTFIGWGPQAA